MDFYRKYELIDPLSGEGARSFRARQIATGREVAVHLLIGGPTPENEALLTRLRALPEGSRRKLIEVGDNDGTTFVATEAPPFVNLAEWLAEQDRDSAADAMKYTRAGTWKIPVAPAPTPPQAPSGGPGEFTRMFQQGGAPAPPPATPQPGEFTRLFQASQAPPPPPPAVPIPQPESPDMSVTKTMRIPLPRLPAAAKTPDSPAAPAAGEFTRMFQAAEPFPQPPVQAAPSPPPPTAQPAPAASQPGEFTRMFERPPAAPAPEPLPPPPPPKPSRPGEFTRVFNAQLPSAPAQGDWPEPPPKPAQAGEFTRMFQSPAPPSAAPPEPSSGGEFTRMFNAGRPSPAPGPQFLPPVAFPSAPAQPFASPQPPAPAAAPSNPGDFTQMFGRPGAGSPTPAPLLPQAPMQPGYGSGSGSGSAGSGATGAFRMPSAAPPPPDAQQGPSEYTQMMRAPSAPAPPPAPQAGAAPQAPRMQMPQMQMPQVQMPQVQMPQAQVQGPHVQMQGPQMQPPHVQMPQVAMAPLTPPKIPDRIPGKAPGPNILLIAILLLLAFLVGALLMVFLLKKDAPKPHATWERPSPSVVCRA